MTISDINIWTRFLCDADATSYTAANLLIAINAAYEEIVGKILDADDMWKWGDTNYSALPTGTTTLVDNQQTYAMPTGAGNVPLTLMGVEIKDINGLWIPLSPITLEDIRIQGMAQQEYYKTKSIPWQYEKRENFIILYPPPDTTKVTASSGLKMFFQRTAQIYTSAEVTTGTKEPGFASPFHILLAYKAALPYCMNYKKDRVPMLMNEIATREKNLTAFYSRRPDDVRPVMSMEPILFI